MNCVTCISSKLKIVTLHQMNSWEGHKSAVDLNSFNISSVATLTWFSFLFYPPLWLDDKAIHSEVCGSNCPMKGFAAFSTKAPLQSEHVCQYNFITTALGETGFKYKVFVEERAQTTQLKFKLVSNPLLWCWTDSLMTVTVSLWIS